MNKRIHTSLVYGQLGVGAAVITLLLAAGLATGLMVTGAVQAFPAVVLFLAGVAMSAYFRVR